MRLSHVILASVVASSAARAQTEQTLPTGNSLRGRPSENTDVVIDLRAAGGLAVNGRAIGAAQLPGELSSLIRRSRDRLVYVRADAQSPYSAIESVAATAARSMACVASLVGTQPPGAMSRVTADTAFERGAVYRTIHVQLPLPRVAPAILSEQGMSAIVLEVLPGPAYRINTQVVAPDNLSRRLREIFSPRPIKILYVRAEPSASYQNVLRVMDLAREAGVIDIVMTPPELTIRDRLPDIDLSRRITDRDDLAAERIDGNIGRCRHGDVYQSQAFAAAGSPGDAPRVFFEFQVEKRATPLNEVALHYPDMLKANHVRGEALVQFVVDTNGLAMPETFKVLRSSHDLFTSAVKAALPAMRFTPATIRGKAVRQLVQRPFSFTITP